MVMERMKSAFDMLLKVLMICAVCFVAVRISDLIFSMNEAVVTNTTHVQMNRENIEEITSLITQNKELLKQLTLDIRELKEKIDTHKGPNDPKR